MLLQKISKIFRSKSLNLFEKNNYKGLQRLKHSSPNNLIILRSKSESNNENRRNIYSEKKKKMDEIKKFHDRLKKPPKKNLRIQQKFPDKQIQIQRLSELNRNIPQVGYVHFRYKDIHQETINYQILPTISKNGVLEVINNQSSLYSIKQYQKMIKSVKILQKNHFFQNFQTIKIFRLWKKYCFSKNIG